MLRIATATGAPQVTNRNSVNWYGYPITGMTGAFQSVSPSYSAPAAGRTVGRLRALVIIWVGLDGANAQSVCLTQAGCDVNATESPGDSVETELDRGYELELAGDAGEVKLGPAYSTAAVSCTITHVDGLEFTIELLNLTQDWTYRQAAAGDGVQVELGF